MRVTLATFITFVTVFTHGLPIPLPPDREMVALMNPKAHPCKDFYRYACGGWMKTELPRTRYRIDSAHTVIKDRIDNFVKQLIEKEKLPIVRELWESCMALDYNEDQINPRLLNDLKRIKESERAVDLMVLAGEFARTGGSVFVKFNIGRDPFDSTRNTLLLRPDLTLPLKFYSEEYFPRVKEDYDVYIGKLKRYGENTLAGKRKRKKIFTTNAGDVVVQIEQRLVEFQKQAGKSLSPVTFKYALEHWPFSFGAQKQGMQLNLNTHGNLRIYVPIDYLNHVEDMIKTYNIEKLRAYISFRMVHSRAQWVGKGFNRVAEDFGEFLNNQKTPIGETRDIVCRKSLMKYIPELIGEQFYAKVFDEKQEGTVLEMFKLIQKSMEERITKSTWLNEKETAKVKLSQVLLLIGKSKGSRSFPTLSPTDYPENIYTILSLAFDQEMKKMGQVRNPEEWPVSAADPNVYYIRDRNAIVLPGAVLQPPLLHRTNPARNFGALGTIIGHELIHGFDSKGSLYNGVGNEFSWWSPPTRSAYGNLAKCFETQYSRFEAFGRRKPDLKEEYTVNGKLTLNENIADNGGVALAWDAYRKYITDNPINGVEPEDGDRMFFLSFAQTWCEQIRDGPLRHHLSWHKESPGKSRVNGVVMNNINFAKAFHCIPDSPMTSSEPCTIW